MATSQPVKPLSRDAEKLSDVVLELRAKGDKTIEAKKLLAAMNKSLKDSDSKGHQWTMNRLEKALFEIQSYPWNK